MKKTFAIAVFYFYMSAAITLLDVAGVFEAWGIESPTGTSQAVEETTAALRDIQASGGLQDTLFGAFAAAAGTVESLGRSVFALPLLLNDLGVPSALITFLFAPAAIIVARDMLHGLTGRFS